MYFKIAKIEKREQPERTWIQFERSIMKIILQLCWEKNPLRFLLLKSTCSFKTPTACKHANLQPHDWRAVLLSP